ncbi:extracellular solute-binding protein [Paenibacillus contaminans]|uniref:ABC transporter substrate-binding protein n=1 Tax=Paenibacillus contaminans TaxID=450362 RepID=A0A329M4Q2_9BACL|nr:extracellular solute-binding protein [Paenibacillus contaminans]RAV13593.1 ABC transporter substrate-binding protein [Paenibacillus contaminans]
MKYKTTAVSLMSLALLASACGKSDQEAAPNTVPSQTKDAQEVGKNDPFSKFTEQITLSLGKSISTKNTNLPNGDTVDNNEFYRYIEKKLNVKVTHAWQTETPDAYQQKLSVSIASQDLPDAFIVKEAQLKQLVEADLIADLTDVYQKLASPLIKDYYKSYGDRVLNRATFNGKLMGLPSTNISGQHSLTWIRQDWLEKLGLQPPKTVDDLINITKAFIEKDPDGNGQKDTSGLTAFPTLAGYNSLNTFDPIFGAYRAYKGQWLKDKSGNISYSSILPEMKTALAKLRDMYAAGVIDKQFAVRKDQNELAAAGKSGIVFGPWWSPVVSPFPDSVKNDPKAEWRPYSVPVDEDGKYNTYDPNPVGSFLVVRKGYKNPEAVMKVLNVEYDGIRLLDPDSKDIYKGLNVSWTQWPFALQLDYEDVVFRDHSVLKKAWEAKDPSKLSESVKPWYDNVKKNDENPKKDVAAWSDATARMAGSAETDPAKYNVVRNVFFGQTKTMEQKWAILQKLENETFLKIILGEGSVDQFDSFVAEWKRLGGDQITLEVEQAAKK